MKISRRLLLRSTIVALILVISRSLYLRNLSTEDIIVRILERNFHKLEISREEFLKFAEDFVKFTPAEELAGIAAYESQAGLIRLVSFLFGKKKSKYSLYQSGLYEDDIVSQFLLSTNYFLNTSNTSPSYRHWYSARSGCHNPFFLPDL